jgi:hypothetical protein
VPTRKMRIELFDGEGNKYTVAFEGQISREKALRVLDLVELLGGMPSRAKGAGESAHEQESERTKYDKVRFTIQKNFPLVWFTSKDLQSLYEQERKEPLSLSTASTYLARMADKGGLIKTGSSNCLKYKISLAIPEATAMQ